MVKLYNSSSLVCVLEPNPAIVSCEHGFFCLSCSRGRDVCDHVKYLHYLKENAHEAPDDVLDLVLTATAVTSQCSASLANKSVISPVSQCAIPFNLTGSLQYVSMHAPEILLPACPNTGALLLVPTLPPTGSSLEKCPDCHRPWNSEDPIVHCWKQNSIKLYARKHLYECNGRYSHIVVSNCSVNMHVMELVLDNMC